MSDPLAHVWAKSPAPGRTDGETLTAHTQEVLGRLCGWRKRNPLLASRTSRPSDLFDLAAWAIVLHDVGKAACGFQRMLHAGPPFDGRHEVLSLALVGKLDVDDETLGLIAAGVATHHKDAAVAFEMYPFGLPARAKLLAELSETDELAWERWLVDWGAPTLLKSAFQSLPARRPLDRASAFGRAMHAFQALVDRLEEEEAICPFALTVRSIRGLLMLADHAGSAHEALAKAPTLSSPSTLIQAAGKRLARGLEPHQRTASQTIGNAILIAPTGSGKTEAALLWASRQHEAGPAESTLFYVLPFRASLNAMRQRIPSYGVADTAVVLQHAATTTALYGQLLEKGYGRVEASRTARHERNLGRLMTAAVRVLTPYQLLRAFFGLPGHEAVLTDAAGGVFILDELHAYDLERLALILVALRHLVRDLGARMLAMSATFPRMLGRTIDELLGDVQRIEADSATQRRFIRHTLRLRNRDLSSAETIEEVCERFAHGEAILIVANTVARAQDIFDRVLSRLGGGVASLLHGRFTGADRTKKEQRLAERVGTGSSRSGAGTVLVATQVVEVSLDIDFDVLFTDPAPIEALLQRFGRVNRGLRGGLRDVVVHTQIPAEARRIYDVDVVERALTVLTPIADRPVEESHVQHWVDAVYEPIEEAWRARLKKLMDEDDEAIVQANRPLNAHKDLADRFDELFDGTEVVPQCFAKEHARLLLEEPLAASGLRVPISVQQRAMLKSKGRLVRHGRGPLMFESANVSYTEERGLDLAMRDDGA